MIRRTHISSIGIVSLCLGLLVGGCGGEDKKKPAQGGQKTESKEKEPSQ